MKRYRKYFSSNILLTLVCMLSVISCSDDFGVEPDESLPELARGGYITLQLTCGDVTTRAVESGVASLNENLIETVTLCLWPRGGDWGETREPYIMNVYKDINEQGEVVIRIPLTETLVDRLFMTDSSMSCNVFVAANVDPGTIKTPAGLRQMTIGSTFAESKVQQSFAMDGSAVAQLQSVNGNRFVLTTVELQRSSAKVDLHLKVKDKVIETRPDGSETEWIPNLEEMKVVFHNGVRSATLDPSPYDIDESLYFNTPADLSYEIKAVSSADYEHGINEEEYPFVQDVPFYTYPNEWDSSDSESPGRSFMTLKLPWSDDGGASYKTCYYRVPVVDPKLDELVRNTSYHVLLNVSVLGSFVPDEPLPLEDLSYTAAEWGVENFDVDIVEPRYLVVDQNDFEVQNQETISIPFYTSHPSEVTDITMTFYRFNYSDEGGKFPVTCTMEMNKLSNTPSRAGAPVFDYDFDNETGVLTVSHPLVMYEPMRDSGSTYEVIDLTNGDGPDTSRPKVVLLDKILATINNPTTGIQWFRQKKDAAGKTEAEFSKVDFYVTVQHSDMIGTEHFKETVHISQYPSMYIDAITNFYTYNSSANSISGTGRQSGTFINANDSAFSVDYNNLLGGCTNGYMTSIGLSSNNLNWNPNLYLITITRFAENTKYILSDPRATDVNNNLSNESMGTKNDTPWGEFVVNDTKKFKMAGVATAKALYPSGTADRKLRWYYPTREESSARWLIAPKFRICSSYAGTAQMLTRVMARRRAAAYQEKGYPAGRWRLPTFGEVEFVLQLADELKIPRLFGVYNSATTWYYWCANGLANVPGKKSTAKPSFEYLGPNDPKNGNNQRTRFVYDEWYWGPETVTVNQFIWGDRERK